MEIRTITAGMYSDYQVCPSLYYYKNIGHYRDILFGENSREKKLRLFKNLTYNFSRGVPVSEELLRSDTILQKWWQYFAGNYPENEKKTFNRFFNVPVKRGESKVILAGQADMAEHTADKATVTRWLDKKPETGLEYFILTGELKFSAWCLSKLHRTDRAEINIVDLEQEKEEVILMEKKDLEETEEKILETVEQTSPQVRAYIPRPVTIDDFPACKECHFYNHCRELL